MDEDSDGEDKLSALRLKRNTYSFMQRKRYSPTKHFTLKKKASDPITRLKEAFARKPLLSSKDKKNAGAKDTVAIELPSNKMIIWVAGAVLASILLFVFIALIIASSSGSGQPPVSSQPFAGNFSAQIFKSGSITYGPQGDGRSQAYFMLDYFGTGIKNATITTRMYSDLPSNQVFVLMHYRDGADTYYAFRQKLGEELSSKGWQVSDVRIDDLYDLPGGCTLIIPTGYLPIQLLGSQDKSFPSISDLAQRGVNVVYIGQAFDQHVMRANGDLAPVDKKLFDALAIEFDKNSRPLSTEGFRLQSPFYTARTSRSRESMLWGSISVIRRGAGYLIFLPETIDGGWVGDGSAAAVDVARLVSTEPYRSAIAQDTFFTNSISNTGVSRQMRFFEPSFSQIGFLRTSFILFDSNANKKEFFIDSSFSPEARGKLYLDNHVFVPEYLGGGRKTVIVDLKEPQSSDEKLYFELLLNGTVVQQIPVEQGLTNTQITRSAPVQFSQSPGTYILRVADRASKVYAATRIEIVGVSVSLEDGSRPTYSFRDGVFNATFYSDGKRIKVPKVDVYLENAQNAKRSSYSNTDSISYSPGVEFKRGTYTFVFDFGSGHVQKRSIEYFLAVNVWERPEIIGLGIVGLLVFAAGIYLRRPEKERFALDIPDFPPQSSRKIHLSSGQILSVFEQVNKDFHWDMMPLSLEEIKSGLRKVLMDGRPTIVGDYNLERMLQTLEQRGLVSSHIGFWALKSWETKTGFSPRLMCTYRHIRNVFVNNAIRFSKLRAIPGCDVKALIGRSEYFLHIFLGEGSAESISRVLSTANVSHTWVLFESQYELDRFKQMLSSSSKYLVLKMNVESKRIRLFTLGEFSKIVATLTTRYSQQKP